MPRPALGFSRTLDQPIDAVEALVASPEAHPILTAEDAEKRLFKQRLTVCTGIHDLDLDACEDQPEVTPSPAKRDFIADWSLASPQKLDQPHKKRRFPTVNVMAKSPALETCEMSPPQETTMPMLQEDDPIDFTPADYTDQLGSLAVKREALPPRKLEEAAPARKTKRPDLVTTLDKSPDSRSPEKPSEQPGRQAWMLALLERWQSKRSMEKTTLAKPRISALSMPQVHTFKKRSSQRSLSYYFRTFTSLEKPLPLSFVFQVPRSSHVTAVNSRANFLVVSGNEEEYVEACGAGDPSIMGDSSFTMRSSLHAGGDIKEYTSGSSPGWQG